MIYLKEKFEAYLKLQGKILRNSALSRKEEKRKNALSWATNKIYMGITRQKTCRAPSSPNPISWLASTNTTRSKHLTWIIDYFRSGTQIYARW